MHPEISPFFPLISPFTFYSVGLATHAMINPNLGSPYRPKFKGCGDPNMVLKDRTRKRQYSTKYEQLQITSWRQLIIYSTNQQGQPGITPRIITCQHGMTPPISIVRISSLIKPCKWNIPPWQLKLVCLLATRYERRVQTVWRA